MDSDPQLDAGPEDDETTPEQPAGDAAVESDAAPSGPEPDGAAPTEPASETVTQDATGQARVQGSDEDGDLPDDEAALLGDGSQPSPYAGGDAPTQEDYR